MVIVRNTALIAALGLLFANSANAQTATYDYSGKLMSDGTTLDGTITLAAPLAANLSNVPVIPTFARFGFDIPDTGGFQTGPGPSYAGFGVGGLINAYTTLKFTALDFSTDSAGAITGWDLTMKGTTLSFESFTATSTQNGDITQYVIVEPNFGAPDQYDNAANMSGGSWSGPMIAPEIDAKGATAALTLLAGLIVVITDRRRQSTSMRRRIVV